MRREKNLINDIPTLPYHTESPNKQKNVEKISTRRTYARNMSPLSPREVFFPEPYSSKVFCWSKQEKISRRRREWASVNM